MLYVWSSFTAEIRPLYQRPSLHLPWIWSPTFQTCAAEPEPEPVPATGGTRTATGADADPDPDPDPVAGADADPDPDPAPASFALSQFANNTTTTKTIHRCITPRYHRARS